MSDVKGKQKLTYAQKNRAHQLFTKDGITQKKIADMYNVSQSTISNAIRDIENQKLIKSLRRKS